MHPSRFTSVLLMVFIFWGKVAGAAPPVRLQRPQRRTFRRTVPFSGQVVPRRKATLRAPLSGYLLAVMVPDETPVKAGKVLFLLGGPEVERKISLLATQIATLKKEIFLAEKRVEIKRKGLSAHLVPYGEFLQAREYFLQLQRELGARKTQLQILKQQRKVRAPFSGIFTRRRVFPGEWVNRGTVLAEVIDPKALWIRALVFAPEGVSLAGKPALIRLRGRILSARITRLAPEKTPAGGRIVFLEGPSLSSLSPYEYVRGEIILEEHREALAVPRQAVLYDQKERPCVFVKTRHGFVQRFIRIGQETADWVEVLSGLKPDEEVVVQGAYELFYRNFPRTYHLPD